MLYRNLFIENAAATSDIRVNNGKFQILEDGKWVFDSFRLPY